MATLLDINGESGTAPAWEWDSIVETGGDFSQGAAAAKHGAGGYISSFTGTTGDSLGVKAFDDASEIYCRFYMETDVWATVTAGNYASNVLISDVGAGGFAVKLRFYKTATAGKYGYRIYVANGTSAINYLSTELFDIGQTYCFEIHYLCAVAGYVAFYIDGALHATSAEIDTSGYSANELRLGLYEGTTANGDTWYYDDVKIATTGPIGVITAAGGVVPQAMQHYRMMRD